MVKLQKRVVFGLVVIVMLYRIGAGTYRYMDRRTIAREAMQAQRAAMAAASRRTTPDDARRWLENHGFRVILWCPDGPRSHVAVQESSVDGKHLIVRGQRQIRADSWLIEPAWLHVSFRFTLDGAFQDVEADPSSLEFPVEDSPA